MLDVGRSTVTPMSLVVTTEYLRGLATFDRVEKAAATAGRAGGGGQQCCELASRPRIPLAPIARRDA